MPTRALALVTVVALALHAGEVRGQARVVAARSRLVDADSGPLARTARAAQARFERERRMRLPWEAGDGMADPARAIHIGRYWYWSDDDTEDPPPEPEAIRTRRDSLIVLLGRVAEAIPGDAWVAGQRVRYLAESGRTDEALEATRECVAARDWCLRLAGYALHVGGRYAAADTAFDAALAAMPDSARCRWLRVGDILEDELRSRWEHAGCSERDAFLQRVLQLGAPFYLTSEAELRTALFARLTRSEIERDAWSPRGVRWGDDLGALTVRYGWSSWFTRTRPPVGSIAIPGVVGHDRGRPFTFLPAAEAVDNGWRATPDAWPLDRPRARFNYTAEYARAVHALPHQLAVFRRGDSLLVVAAYDVSADTAFHDNPVSVGLFAVDGEGHAIGAPRDSAGDRGIMELRIARGRWVASVEVLDRTDRAGARARYGLGPRAFVDTVADVLVYRAASGPAASLDDALQRAYATTSLSRRERLGIYWELPPAPAAGFGTGEVAMALTIEPVRAHGALRSLARRIGLGDHRRSLRLTWRDHRRGGATEEPRSLIVDVGRLAEGRYEMRLVARTDDGPVVAARREIELVR